MPYMAIIKNITMTKEEFSKLLFLLDNSLEDRESLTSTVKLLLLGGREFSGRNINTGIKDGSDIDDFETKYQTYCSKRFIGLFLYLMLLEVIGSTFNRKDKPSSENDIKRALDLFSDKITDDCFNEISGLRNSLAHRFSLCTENKGAGKSFCYNLLWDKTTFIVEKPKFGDEWSGDFSTKIDKSSTKIGVENLIEHIEDIYTKLITELKSGELETIPDIPELKARYTISI
jgi:hypothetical protein